MKLQSILYPTEQICNEEALYLHRDGSFILFDGYFNLFYLEKHKKYCKIDEMSLELKAKGIKKIVVMHDREVVDEHLIEAVVPSGMERLAGKGPSRQIEQRISIKLPYASFDKGVLWFKAEVCDYSEEWLLNGYYSALGSEMGINDSCDFVELAVNICTYKREQYVVRNMKSLISWMATPDIDGKMPEIADHMHVFIVDNGRTLMKNDDFLELVEDNQEILGERIRVIQNSNTGGAGGFTRGMVEAIKQKEEYHLTHILLMDDDAVFDPDLFIRLYGILSFLKTEYKDLTVGGALWRQDYPFIQYASGEWYEHMDITNEIPSLDLRFYETCIVPEMCTTENEYQRYSGWWCCCYSLDTVRMDNLPIKQMFIHMDDIEYEKRNRLDGNPIAFFNGIGVWHKAFDTEFLGVKTYYNTRNSLILSSKLEPELSCHIIKKRLCRMLIGNCLDNRYLKMHLIYMGIMDYLKGRKWFESLDTEAHHQYLLKYVKVWQEKMMITDLDDNRIRTCMDDIMSFQNGLISFEEVISMYKEKNVHLPFYKKITLNGKLLPSKKDVTVVFPHDRLWKKGYRSSRYVFVQRDPNKVYYVKNKLSERLVLVGMLISVFLKFRKASVDEFRE